MSGFIESTLLGFGQDYVQDELQTYAEEHFQPVRDPYYTKDVKTGEEHRLKLSPDLFPDKKDRKNFKSLQNEAWNHDRSIFGCCCWTSTIGWGPMLSIIPVIGPALMYWIHSKLIDDADKKFHLSTELKLKMNGNIFVDLCISLVPIAGVILAWMHACSTRNCALVYNFIVKRQVEKINLEKKQQFQQLQNEKRLREQEERIQRVHQETYNNQNNQNNNGLVSSQTPSRPAQVAYRSEYSQQRRHK
ncbi:uncharacterized protein NDAI_0J01700 [Naumovozyma dairenensis CBS 421]|uniref:Uncharacterized protein n=1 Tax=Naumovozyma dairenensis (strain ATCC 10597 / BCRC 20456 / CBS 421 / NBRC 0211 / NRRL Y-12639) TaxID=1071378 RepID=G0WGY4_NAUDC|nr:hypothetical protein NDAI_0J01700 [Naumovozyma dairenensis CBS 421]CCD27062.1 hypothetical protein NDAI_0J01700 [Naumovozyma dairenensis CBS 421]